MATTDIYSVAGSLIPMRHSIRLLGGDVDDAIQIDALAAAIVAGNHTKGTITAWVMAKDDVNTYTVVGFGDANAVEYMEFKVAAGKLQFKIVDAGPSTRVDVITTSQVIKPHTWHHVAVVQDGVKPLLYVDGELVALTLTTTTEYGQWFDDTDGIDSGSIGASDSIAGGAALTNEWAGYISDVKIWSGTTAAKALSQDEIKKDMSGASTSETPLAWYKMDGNVVDYGTGGGTYDGTVVGAIIYCDANEFSSRFSFGCGTPVSGANADDWAIGIDRGMGFAILVQYT